MDVSERPRRHSERKVPAHPVPISVEAEDARATGEVVNVSEGGACIALDAAGFRVGDELILWMHPTQPRQTVPATGRVIWLAAERGRPRCGLEWTHRGPHRHWIHWLAEA
jgi:hypothetical protein